MGGGGGRVLITGPRQPSRRAACVGGGEEKGAGKVVEQQTGALGNPCSSFSSPSPLLCIRRGFDKTSLQAVPYKYTLEYLEQQPSRSINIVGKDDSIRKCSQESR